MNTVNDTLHQAAVKAEQVASDVAANAEDAGHDVADYVSKLGKAFFGAIGVDAKTPLRVLDRLGLEPRGHGRMAAFGAFSVGVLVGGGAALMFAPMSGRNLRKWMRDRVAAMTRDSTAAPTADGAHEVILGAADLTDADKKEIRNAAGLVDLTDERSRRAASGTHARVESPKDGHGAATPFSNDGVGTHTPPKP